MKNKTTNWALGLLAVYAVTLLVGTLSSGGDMYAGIGYMIVMLFAVGLEVGVLLILGLVWHFRSRKEVEPLQLKTQSRHFLLAALMVFLIGFSVCVGGGALVSG